MLKNSIFIKLIAVLVLSFGVISTGFAAGDDDPEPIKCKDGEVWSDKLKKCVVKSSEILTDEDLYKVAVSSIEAKDYKTGLDLLYRIKDQNQPHVLNYLGYANRKMGKIDEGIKYYQKALKIDANFNQARQYLGEGYLQKGDLPKAQEQLSEIEKREGKDNKYYKDLSEQIASYKDGKLDIRAKS